MDVVHHGISSLGLQPGELIIQYLQLELMCKIHHDNMYRKVLGFKKSQVFYLYIMRTEGFTHLFDQRKYHIFWIFIALTGK